MAKKTNWQKLKAKKPRDTIKYRDVYEDQQLDRSEIEGMQTMTSRLIFTLIFTIIVFIVVYFLTSFIVFTIAKFKGKNTAVNTVSQTGYQLSDAYDYWNDNQYFTKDQLGDVVKMCYDNYESGTIVEDSTAYGLSGVPEINPFDGYAGMSNDDLAAKYFMYYSGAGADDGTNTTGDGSVSQGVVHPDSENPFAGYADLSTVELAHKWGDEVSTGVYQLKSEYNYWNDTNRYQSWEFTDVIAAYYAKYRVGDIPDNTDSTGGDVEQPTQSEYYNPFAGYTEMRATDMAEKFCNPTADGKWTFKDEYNFWNDPASYYAYQIRDILDSYYKRYDAEYNGITDGPGNGGGGSTDIITSADMAVAGFLEYCKPGLWNLLMAFLAALIFFLIVYTIMKKNLDAQNMLNDTTDINQYKGDQHIALPEEVMRKFDWFPDAGAHCPVQVSSMISHVMLINKGINPVDFTVRHEKDVVDEDGMVAVYAGEPVLDDDDNIVTKKVPFFDTKFAEDIFETSGVQEKAIRRYYDPTKIPYNGDGRDRTKQGGKWGTVAEMINNTWHIPDYEPQRPAGAYLVDTEPVNTMVLAITRAGKGQTVIEPTIDMWTREDRPNNMVINDPKGELLLKFYVRATVRGFEIVQFNLINPIKTDIYNPLDMAAQAAKEGDITKCALYVENIAEVFFPLDGGEDPVWPNAANNAFKRAAYGLIDYYLEEEKEMRLYAERTHMEPKVLEAKLDELWGHVTLYNCYQLFVQLTSRKLPNPAVEWQKRAKNGEFDQMSDEEYQAELDEINKKTPLWENKPEADLLTLYFNATAKLPVNQIRTQVQNTNNALRSMSGAEKMMASVYGIAITAMSFFTDPTISTLTSGRPSQNVDLAGISFPRRLGVRFAADFLKRYHLIGMQCKWDAFEDVEFKKPLGKDFTHSDMITREGWARFYFKGIFSKDTAYCRCRIYNPQTNLLIRTFFFKFTKSYRTSLDGRRYQKDPVLGTKLVKDGILVELKQFKKKDGTIVYKAANTTFKQVKIRNFNEGSKKETVDSRAIIGTMARYSEKVKAIYLVTPPHLMKYAKLILILVKQLVNLNFDQSYMTKSNQKPLYKTRFMLDELGNLQSEGHGIDGFSTMLSIGLGQEQQFTLILQTLQQLRDVYGDSVDKIVQGNTSNIVFLKSTDDSMLDTLQKMSGTTHRVYKDSKTVTRDAERLFMQNEGKVSYTMNVREEPVIKYNDMAFINERNSIVFRAGDSPIWNRNETILPMAWRLLHTNPIKQPGKEYDLQTVPSLSTAIDFDVRKNQPDFVKMLDKRMSQAYEADACMKNYQNAYGYSDYEIEQIDPDVYADEIMDMINMYLRSKNEAFAGEEEDFDYIDAPDAIFDDMEENTEVKDAVAQKMQEQADRDKQIYAGGCIARSDLVVGPNIKHQLDDVFIRAYNDVRGRFEQDRSFRVANGSLLSADGTPYIIKADVSSDLQVINDAAEDKKSTVYAEGRISSKEIGQFGTYTVTDDFIKYLVSLPKWTFAGGEFDRAVGKLLSE